MHEGDENPIACNMLTYVFARMGLPPHLDHQVEIALPCLSGYAYQEGISFWPYNNYAYIDALATSLRRIRSGTAGFV